MSIVSALMPAPRAKAETGIGAVMMTTRPHISVLTRSPWKQAAEAQAIVNADPTIRAAERAISNRAAALPWHLETADGTTVGTGEGEDATPALLAIRDLLEKPYRPLPGDPHNPATPRTFAGLKQVTFRHMGACGIGFWYLDQVEALAGTPLQILYVNPARMMPAQDSAGNVLAWWLDRDKPGGGVLLELDRVIPFLLEPADEGVFPTGLVATALAKVEVSRLADRHVTTTLAAGGRLAGVMGPKEGTLEPEQFEQLKRDVRTIAESPDSARRMLILQGPVDYTPATANVNELALVDVSRLAREDKLALWGTPQTILGIPAPGGLGQGEGSREADEATFWQNAVGPRMAAFVETLQARLLDRYAELGAAVTYVAEEPTFDDETPAYERAHKAQVIPLTNDERRDLVGLDPHPDPEIGRQVWLPSTLTRVWPEPDEPVVPVPPPVAPPTPMTGDEALPVPGDLAAAKASVPGLRALRTDVGDALSDIGRDIARRVRRSHAHLVAKRGRDDSSWWDQGRVERLLTEAIEPHVRRLAGAETERVDREMSPAKATFEQVVARLLPGVGVRIRGIADHTRERVQALIERGIADGLGAAELGDLLERDGPFDELRAETIARTESARVLNTAALESYREYGVARVIASDGDADDVCARRNGQTFTLDEAMGIEDHPNGTLSWSPVIAGA